MPELKEAIMMIIPKSDRASTNSISNRSISLLEEYILLNEKEEVARNPSVKCKKPERLSI